MYVIEGFTHQLRRGKSVKVKTFRSASLVEARAVANSIFETWGIVVAITKS